MLAGKEKTTDTYQTQGQECLGHDLLDVGNWRRSETPHNTNTVRRGVRV